MTKEQIEAFLNNVRMPLNMIVDYAQKMAGEENADTRKLYAELLGTNSKLVQQFVLMQQDTNDSFLNSIRTPLGMIVDYAQKIAGEENAGTRKLYADLVSTNNMVLQQIFNSQSTGAAAPAPTPAAAPVQVQAPAATTPVAPTPAAPAPATQPTASHAEPRSKATLLVAEDNENNYLLVQALLEDTYNLIHAWDGEEAVALFKEHNPNLILMDISMPKMDGYEATKEIRKLSASVPIIAVTAYAFASDKERIMSIGFSSYISKPINPEKLEAEIINLL